ncbi:MAG: sodium-dependent transporter, partial [Muribaculaceae bacterium]|nr:sodium-dependent transporter [Muribaculaceae bacterium]
MGKKEINKDRAVFATKFAAVATTVGSAVGLGNIWRFPYEAGMHGGGAFLICYMAFVLLIGVPVLWAEFFMGRTSRSNIFGAYGKMNGGRIGKFAGVIGILASLMILSFYSVVAGWTVEYYVASVCGDLDFSDTAVGHQQFVAMTSGWRPVQWTVCFLLCNMFILLGGVTKGIERASNIMMPILFGILIVFCINAFSMPGFGEGIRFLFYPDFSQLSSSVLLGAMGQAFFSLSLGLGCMMTYASYFSAGNRLARTAVTTAVLDSLVAVLAGVIIFPAVFSFGMSPESGPTLVFEVLPSIFSQLPGGQLWSILFFLLLFLASLTSTVSMSEISIAYFCEERKMTRRNATLLSSALALAGGVLCALSFGPLAHVTVFGMTIFDLFDYATSNIALPLGGMIVAIFVGWMVDRNYLRNLYPGKPLKIRILVACLRWICPAAIFLIFLNSIGLIRYSGLKYYETSAAHPLYVLG